MFFEYTPDEKTIDELILDVYYKLGKETSQVYEDATDGYDYIKGRYSLRDFNLLGKKDELIIQQHKTGKYITTYKTFKLNLHGLPFKISKIEVDNVEIPFSKLKLNGDNTLTLDKEFTELHIMA